MITTLLKLQQAHHKVARVSGQLALSMATKRLKKSELVDMVSSLEQARAAIEEIINAQD